MVVCSYILPMVKLEVAGVSLLNLEEHVETVAVYLSAVVHQPVVLAVT